MFICTHIHIVFYKHIFLVVKYNALTRVLAEKSVLDTCEDDFLEATVNG